MCFWPLDVNLFLSWNTSTSPWILLNGRLKPGVFLFSFGYVWCFEQMLQWFTVKTESLGLVWRSSLLFLSSIRSRLPSVSPSFIYRLRNCRGGDGGRDGKSILKLEDSLAPVCCLKKEHTILLFSSTHFSFLLFSLFLSFLKSSSAPLWAGFKDSKCEESNSVWVKTADRKLPTRTQFTLFIGWLYVFCVSAVTVFFLYTDIQSQHWLWWA